MKDSFLYKSIVLIFVSFNVLAQTPDLNFKRYTKKEGLSSNDITAFAQTPDGYMWIGTTNGLNRFDGYEFKSFRNQPKDSTSISDNSITALMVDHNDVLWIGTEHAGLLRYIPEKEAFEHYDHDRFDNNSLSNSYVTSIKQDINNRIWIGTVMGLNLYLPDTNKFRRYFHETSLMINDKSLENYEMENFSANLLSKLETIKDSIFSNREVFQSTLKRIIDKDSITVDIETIYRYSHRQENASHIRHMQPDSNGNLWLAYDDGGLSHFNSHTNELSPTKLTQEKIGALLTDNGSLWIGLNNGELYNLNISTRDIKQVSLPDSTEGVEAIFKDADGNLWIGHHYGLYIKKSSDSDIESYKIDPLNKWDVATPAIKKIFQDDQENVWIGIVQGGVSQVLKNMPFNTFNSKRASPIKLTKDCISSVLEDSQGRLWVGYYTAGIDLWDPKKQKLIHFDHTENDPKSLGKGTVFSIMEDHSGSIWLGTYEGGLQQYVPENQNFKSFRHDSKNSNTISGNDVRSIKKDSKGNLWLAIHGGGVNRFSLSDNKVTRYYADYLNWENALSNDWVYTIEIDHDDNLWIAGVSGITKFSQDTNEFKSYNTKNSLLSHDKVRSLHLDSKNNLWIGTENGINCFNTEDNTFITNSVFDELANTTITGIASDKNNDLWIATKYSLSRLGSNSNNLDVFKESDAFTSNEFFAGASGLGNEGTLYFGGFQGLLTLHPEKVTINTSKIPLVLTSTHVNYNTDQQLAQPLFENGNRYANFKHDQNYIKLNYKGINFEHAQRLEYAYKLDGYDRNWNYVGTTREANYSNIPHGNYTFKVKATSGHDVWTNPQTLISFKIAAPWWKTTWASLGYIVFSVVLIFLFKRFITRKERLKNELKLTLIQEKFIQEFDALKIKFYAGISKDIQAPFNLIKKPLEKLISGNDTISPKKRLTYFKLINENALKVIGLIEKLSDISAFDSDLMPLQVSKHDIINYSKLLTNSFNYRAKKKHLRLSFQSQLKTAEVYFDVKKLEKILYYLISHELQNSKPNGHIKVSIDSDGDEFNNAHSNKTKFASDLSHIKITIKSTGHDTSANIKSKKSLISETEVIETNYAIALGKQLTLLHLGSFNLSINENNAIYTLRFPVSKAAFSDEQIVSVTDIEARVKGFEISINSDQIEDSIKEGFWATQDVSQKQDESPFMVLLYEIIDSQIGNNQFGPDTLAEYMNLSRSQLYKKVKTLTNLSVSIVIRNRRLAKSLALLFNTEYTISEIAYTMGFNDPAYYTKCFKKLYGKSPREYVQQAHTA